MKPVDPRTAKTRARGRLLPFNDCTIGVAREWPPHWERHPQGDELLHVLEGEVEVELRERGGRRRRTTVPAGSFFVVPRGLWHRPLQRKPVVMLYVTPGVGTEATFEEEPPAARPVRRRRRPRPAT
jgi:mannose-6-phosphate isomerase-like protein (cupin superfamily)